MRLTKERGFVLCGLVAMGLMFAGLVVAQWLPPPRPTESAHQVAAMYRAHAHTIRAGILLCTVGAGLLGPFMAMISVQLRRIEGRSPASTYCQMILGGLLIVELIFPLMILATAAFRPSRPESTIQTLNDLGWLMLVGVVTTSVVELAVIGVAIVGDRHQERVFPLWGAGLNFLAALAFAGGALSIWFTTGPLAWNGLVAYWIPVFAFAFWILGMSLLLLRAIARQEAEEGQTPAPGHRDGPLDRSSDIVRLTSEVTALRREVALLSQAGASPSSGDG
jgi:hypothetical protein